MKSELILGYIKQHNDSYGLQISDELGIDRTTTNRIINKLHDDGRITFLEAVP